MVPNILVNKFICEIYPFSGDEITSYRQKIDFNYLSKNQNLNWSYGLIKRFESQWNWDFLDKNREVFKKVTLGLLFPDRINLQDCDCFLQTDFCEYSGCKYISRKLSESISLYDDFPELFLQMRMLLESGAIDKEMIAAYYTHEDPYQIIKLDFNLIT